MFGVKEFDKVFERISVSDLWVGCAGSRRGDDVVRHIAEVEPCLRVSGARPGDYLAQ